MTANKQLLTNYQEFDVPETVRLGDGHTVEAYGSGQVKIALKINKNKDILTILDKVLFVPKLACNLFSIRAVTQKGYIVQFGHSCCWIKDSNGNVRGKGHLSNRMYKLISDAESTTKSHEVKKATIENPHQLDLWHQRLGHVNKNQLLQTIKNSLIKGVNFSENDRLNFCEGCVEGKLSRKPFKSVGGIKTTRKLQIVHSDVCGPMPVQIFTGKLYFVTFIDDYTRCVKVYFIRKKSEVLAKLKEFEVAATNEAGCSIGTLRTDNGGEYTSHEFEAYLKRKGIKHETSVSHSPQQNGVAERMNRTLLESARAMVYHAGLSKAFWAEAINTAAYIRNRVVTATTGQSPYERWYGTVPDVSKFRVFGCIAYAHIPDAERKKLDKKATKLRFLGYSETQKGYRLLNLQGNNKVIVKRDVIFNELDFRHQKKSVQIIEDNDINVKGSLNNEAMAKEEEEVSFDDEGAILRRSQRSTKGVPPARFGLDDSIGVSAETHVAFHAAIKEPESIQEAFNGEYFKEWKEAVDTEYQSLLENETWELVDLPENRKAIGCKWVFKIKYDENGKMERFKGRLVAKGYSQQYKIDYAETFSPVVRFSSIRTLLVFAVQRGMIIHQMDVFTAFLSGELDEEIYMEQHEGNDRRHFHKATMQESVSVPPF